MLTFQEKDAVNRRRNGILCRLIADFQIEAPARIVRVDRTMNHSTQPSRRRHGVVGVIFRHQRLLIIRRSLHVIAPGKLCLPGGGIESGETEPIALVREMREELAIDVQPIRLCWRSTTPMGTKLAWWIAHLEPDVTPIANPEEVAEVHWMTKQEIRTADDMLPSLPSFLDAWDRGDVNLDL